MSSQRDEAPVRDHTQVTAEREPTMPGPATAPGATAPGPATAPSPTEPAAATPTPTPAPPPPGNNTLPSDATAAGAPAASLAWKATGDGKVVFRRGAPLVLWWLWVAFVVFNLVDIAIPDHNYFSVELTAGLLAVTAVTYACALRPRVVADDDAIYVYNPYRDHQMRWGAVKAVHLGDSLELTCACPSPGKDKIIYCWAVYSGRRSRHRSELRAERHEARVTGRSAAEISALRRPDPVNLIAAELGRRSTAAQQRGVPHAVLESRWAWLPVAYFAVPAAVLLALVLAR